MVDMLPDPWWRVPVAVAAALLYDEEAGERAASACEPVRDSWEVAARRALRDPELASAARVCIEAASAALARLGADSDTRSAVDGFAERYVNSARCPAEDVLDSWRAGHSPLGDDAFVDAPAWSA